MAERMLPHDILSTIERIRADLGPSLQRVAAYVLDNAHRIGSMSLGEVAGAAGTSKASVVRLCQALGFSGFRELQRAFAPGALEQDAVVREAKAAWGGGSPLPSGPSATLAALVASVQGTQRLLPASAVDVGARRIVRASRIVWYGAGDSGFLALSADHRCMINGLNSRAVTSSRDVRALAPQLTKDDVLICISRSGRLPYLVQAVRTVKTESDGYLAAITGDPGAPLAQVVDLALVSAPVDIHAQGKRTTLQTAQMAVLDTLIARVLELHYGQVELHGVPPAGPVNGDDSR